MIEEAEAELGRVEVITPNVQLRDAVVEHVVRQSHVLGRLAASLVVVGRHIGAEAAERAQAVARDRHRGALAFGHLHADVVVLRTRRAPVADAAPVEVVRTAGRSRRAAVAPDGRTYKTIRHDTKRRRCLYTALVAWRSPTWGVCALTSVQGSNGHEQRAEEDLRVHCAKEFGRDLVG